MEFFKKLKNFFLSLLEQEIFFFLAMPAVVWQVFFLLIPALVLVAKTFVVYRPEGLIFGLGNYFSCFDKAYFSCILNSLVLAYKTAFFSLLVSLPLSLVVNFWVRPSLRVPILLFLMLPSWTNFIIRIYSWFFLLRDDAFFPLLLKKCGLLSQNSSLLANSYTAQMVMVYCYFPFMLVPINSAIANLEPKLLEASSDLGASIWQTFLRIIFPLIARGVFFGCLIVVLSAFGECVIPDFVEGAKSFYWGNVVVSKFLFVSDHGAGGAIVFVGLAVLAGSVFVFSILFRLFLSLLHYLFYGGSNFVLVNYYSKSEK